MAKKQRNKAKAETYDQWHKRIGVLQKQMQKFPVNTKEWRKRLRLLKKEFGYVRSNPQPVIPTRFVNARVRRLPGGRLHIEILGTRTRRRRSRR